MTYKYLITVSGELPFKSWRSRPKFYRVLIKNISEVLQEYGSTNYSFKIINAKIFLESDIDVLEDLSRVFGVMKIGEVDLINFNDLKDLVSKVGEKAVSLVTNKKFAVRVKRFGTHEFTSLDVARELGAFLKPYSAGVDLEKPEVEIHVEIRGPTAYFYKKLISGVGGLPIGTEGHALSLFSGGIDSPVATWLVAKRGIKIDFLHFFMGSPSATRLAFTVAKTLTYNWFYGHNPRFYVIDLTHALNYIRTNVRWEFRQVVLKTLMYYLASKIAAGNYDAVVTGESIGQTSSQTLVNLSAAQLVSGLQLPVLRPLIGLDKEEIVSLARRIGTYETSSMVGEPCSIAPSRVRTKVSVEELRSEFMKLPEDLMTKVLNTLKVFEVRASSLDDVVPDKSIVIDYIPDDAVVIDLRDLDEYLEWHYPGALHYEKINLEELRDKTLILYCDKGNRSYVEALKLREKGFKAYSFLNGAEGLRRGSPASQS
ncbi:MAG: THUMP domain-containing protein [Desulfurococcaceae archaeon TW002]